MMVPLATRAQRRAGVLSAVYAAIAAITVSIVRAGPAVALAGGTLALAAELLVAALLVAAALARPRGWFAALLAATGLAVPLAEWNAPSAGAAFGLGLVLFAAWPPLLAAAALRGPDEAPLGRAGAAALALAALAGVGTLGLACAAVFDPAAQGCVECPANPLLLVADTDAWRVLSRAGLGLTIAWTALAVALLVLRVARAVPGRRLIAAPVLAPAATALALYGAQAAHGLHRGFLSNDPVDRALWAAQLAALALTAAGTRAEPVRRRRARAALARLVVELGAAPAGGGLRDRLAVTLGDPGLALLHRREDGSWIGGDGHAAAAPSGPEATLVVAGGEPMSALVHRPGSLDHAALAAELGRTGRLALEHERLHALHRARLEQLRASRARLVAAADAERRRLERDLHDGTQQRLVTLALEIRLARHQVPGLAGALAPIEQEMRAAVGELRELARGLYPAVLADEGLAAGLEALSDEHPALALRELAEGRFPERVEWTAYLTVTEALRAGPVTVTTRATGHGVILELAGAAPTTRIEDRIGAAGGTLLATPDGLRAELPCAS
jgi:signal transduction histidine kinase